MYEERYKHILTNKVQQEKLYEKINVLRRFVTEHDLPFFLCIVIENADEKTGYIRMVNESDHARLTDDHIQKHITISQKQIEHGSADHLVFCENHKTDYSMYYKVSEKVISELDTILLDLQKICVLYGLPMFASIAVTNDQKITDYYSMITPPAGSRLYQDEIFSHLLICCGFKLNYKGMPVPERSVPVLLI